MKRMQDDKRFLMSKVKESVKSEYTHRKLAEHLA